MKSAIIIGGGIAGCSTAYALAKRGIAVTLLEQHADVAQEASGNPIAILYPKVSTQPNWQVQLLQSSLMFTLDLLNSLPNQATLFNACGQIQLAYNAQEQARQTALLVTKNSNKNHCLYAFLNAKEASDLARISLHVGGIFLKQAGWVKPQALCQTLVAQNNITKFGISKALSIEKTASGWRVITQKATCEADNVIICNANAMQQFGFCASAKMTPVRGQVNFFAENSVSQSLTTILCSDHFVSPAVDGVHSFGTTYAPYDMSPEVSALDSKQNLAALHKISPQIAACIQPNNLTARVAWRSQTLDYLPLAGQLLDEVKLRNNPPRYNANAADLPWLQGLYVNAGHGSKGMMTAPLCGDLIANLICNTALPVNAALASRLNPSRFGLREIGLKQLAATLYNF